MDVYLWLVFTSNLISQTTWLKVKLKLENFYEFSVWLVFTSNLNSQTTWLKVNFKLGTPLVT